MSWKNVSSPSHGSHYTLPFRASWDFSLVIALEAKRVVGVGPEENKQCLAG